MTAPQTLLQAAASRLAARLGSGLADTAAELAVVAQEAPERFRREWTLFWEEVEKEAARIESGDGGGAAGDQTGSGGGDSLATQDRIDALRARVADLSRRLEQEPRQPS
jgi:uncharacterized protein YceH (UPF0502 family)